MSYQCKAVDGQRKAVCLTSERRLAGSERRCVLPVQGGGRTAKGGVTHQSKAVDGQRKAVCLTWPGRGSGSLAGRRAAYRSPCCSEPEERNGRSSQERRWKRSGNAVERQWKGSGKAEERQKAHRKGGGYAVERQRKAVPECTCRGTLTPYNPLHNPPVGQNPR